MKEITRREFLKMGGKAAIALGVTASLGSLTGCFNYLEGKEPSKPEWSIILDNGIKALNIPRSIPSETVDVAKSPFVNTIGGGTEGFVAEPGGLLVGPDFGSKSDKNPYGNNPAGWDAMYDSKGAIEPFSSVTQAVLRTKGPEFQNLPEGGFVLGSFAKATVKIGDVVVEMPAVEDNNYIFIVRGRYGDNEQNTDRNLTMEISNYFAGHALVNMYQASRNTNTAFVSEGQFKQMAQTSHSGGSNTGDGGASRLTVVMFDTNTRAFTVIQQDKARFQDVATGWKSLFSNWNTKPTR